MLKVAVVRDIWLNEYTLPFTDDSRFEIIADFKYDKWSGIPWKIHSMESTDPILSFASVDQHISSISSIEELELLEQRLEYMTEKEKTVFKAAVEGERPASLRQIINLSYNLDCYDHANSEGQKDHSYVEVYSGDGILPDPAFDKNALFVLRIQTRDKNRMPSMYSLALPISGGHYHMARSVLMEDLDQCSYTGCGGPFQELYGYLPVGARLSEINRLAVFLKHEILNGTKETPDKIMAVLEAECPRTIEDAASVVRHLDDYYVLSESDKTSGMEPASQRGAVRTEHGIVTSRRWKCERLDEEYAVSRFYVSLRGHIWTAHCYYDEPVNQRQLASYIGDIQETIDLYEEFRDGNAGLAEYFKNRLLRRRVESMNPSVEVVDRQLWGRLEIKSHGELTAAELDAVISEWQTQCDQEWGKEFEQVLINRADGEELYVSFNNPNARRPVITEQELKGEPIEEEDISMSL